MKSKRYDEIVCIVDRSGSMQMIKSDVIGGFNKFLKEQKKLKKPAKMTIVLFDDEYLVPHDKVDLKSIEPFNDNTYEPRNTTALLDAIGKTITTVGARLKKTKKSLRPDKVIVCIVTDGLENASREYKRTQIFDMIKEQKEAGWEFLFLAANQDAIKEGGTMGFYSTDCRNFNATPEGTLAAWCCCGSNVTVYRGY